MQVQVVMGSSPNGTGVCENFYSPFLTLATKKHFWTDFFGKPRHIPEKQAYPVSSLSKWNKVCRTDFNAAIPYL